MMSIGPFTSRHVVLFLLVALTLAFLSVNSVAAAGSVGAGSQATAANAVAYSSQQHAPSQVSSTFAGRLFGKSFFYDSSNSPEVKQSGNYGSTSMINSSTAYYVQQQIVDPFAAVQKPAVQKTIEPATFSAPQTQTIAPETFSPVGPVLSSADLNSIISNTISNTTVANYMMSNSYVLTYMSDNPPSLGYMLNSSDGTNAVFDNPTINSVTLNGTRLVYFMSNPSFGDVVQDPGQFNYFVNETTNSMNGDPKVLAGVLANPSLAELMNNPGGYINMVNNPAFSLVVHNPILYETFAGNPALASIVNDNSTLVNFLNGAAVTEFENNQGAMEGLLSNPAIVGIAGNDTFMLFVVSSNTTVLLNNSAFVSFIGNPGFYNFATNSNTVSAVTQNAPSLTGMINDPSLTVIMSNQILLGSLLGNPSLSQLLNSKSESELAYVITDPKLVNITNSTATFSVFLSNPSLPEILANIDNLDAVATSSSSKTLTATPAMMSLLLSNPALGSVLKNSGGLTSLLGSNTMSTVFSKSPASFSELMSSPQLAAIAANPTAFMSFFSSSSAQGNAAMAGIASNPVQFMSFLNNPEFGTLLSNPSMLNSFTSNPTFGTIVNNNYYLASLLGNSNMDAVLGNPSGLSSFMGNSQLSSILSNPAAFANLLGNSAMGSMLNNQNQLGSFLDNATFQGFLSNASIMASVMGNPSLGYITGHQGQLGSFLGNSDFSEITGGPNLLGSILGNPSFPGIMNNPGLLSSALTDSALSGLFSNISAYTAFLSNPGLTNILGNPYELGNLANLLNDPSLSNFMESGSLANLMSNTQLSNMLNNQAQMGTLTTMLGNSQFSGILSNPGFANMLSSQGIVSIIKNPALPSIMNNPAIVNVFDNSGLITFMNDPSFNSFMRNPALSDILSNPQITNLLSDASFTNLIGVTGITGVLSDTQLNNLLNLKDSLGAFKYPGLGGDLGLPGLPACLVNTAWVGICVVVNTTFDITQYADFAGEGGITSIPTVSSILNSPKPLIQSVLLYNQQSAQNLITCPVAPNPSNTIEYFVSESNSFIAGNRCLASIVPLITPVSLYTFVAWTPLTPAFAYNQYSFGSNLANGWLELLAYSGETVTQGYNKYNISDGYNTESYIFGAVPPSEQHAVWTWNAKYANLSKIDISKLVFDKTFTGLQMMLPMLCEYTYTYQVHSQIIAINNINVDIPQYNSIAYNKGDWLNYGGYLFSPVKKVSASSSSCFTDLESGWNCGGWTKISVNGTLAIDGGIINNLNLYYGSSSYSKDPNADFGQSIIAAYVSPYGGNYYAEIDANNIDYTSVNIVPYIQYHLSIPTAYTQLSKSVSYYNQTFSIYNPHNYLNPGNYLDQFTLYGNDGFFATYNDVLTMYPLDTVSVSNPQPNDLFLGKSDFLSILSPQAAKSANLWQTYPVALGQWAYGRIFNPAYISVSPNGYIYAVNYSTPDCGFWDHSCWLSKETTAYLFTFRYVPEGYLNLSAYQPSTMPYADSYQTWNSEWQGYFANTLLSTSQNIYFNVELLSAVKESTPLVINSWFGGTTNKGGLLSKFIPLAMQSDNNGDLFLVGAHCIGCDKGFKLAVQLSGVRGQQVIENTLITQPSGFVPSQEFAVSPGGQYVYLANASDPGFVLTYSTVGVVSKSTTSSSSSSSSGTLCPNGATKSSNCQICVGGLQANEFQNDNCPGYPKTTPLTTPTISPSSESITSGQSVTFSSTWSGGTASYTAKLYSTSTSTCSWQSGTFVQMKSGLTSGAVTFSPVSPTSTTYYCILVSDSSSTPVTVNSITSEIQVQSSQQSSGIPASLCNNVDKSYQGSSNTITFQQVVACAEAAGFTGDQLIIMVSIAMQESSFKPGNTNYGGTNCVAIGILQGGQCALIYNYNPATCNTYTGSSSLATVFYNPDCSFKWAYGYVAHVEGESEGSVCGGAWPYCYWQSYTEGQYCKYAPTTFSGYLCPQGSNIANFPWYLIGAGCKNGAVNTDCTTCADGTQVSAEPNKVCPLPTTTAVSTAPQIQSSGFVWSGNIPLSYSNATYGMNIASYLSAGGPYHDPAVAQAWTAIKSRPVYDTQYLHHPVSITDSKGILYVVDNWTFVVDNKESSILMLRAFTENGVELPINPTLVNDFVYCNGSCGSNPNTCANGAINPTACNQWTCWDGTTVSNLNNCPPPPVIEMPANSEANSLAYNSVLSPQLFLQTGTSAAESGQALLVQPSHGWAPYGWPLAANITLPNGNVVSYCIYECKNTPYAGNSVITGNYPYPPIGPRIYAQGGFVGNSWNSIQISADYNGTLYLIAHVWSFKPCGSGFFNDIGDWIAGTCDVNNVVSESNPDKSLYTDLLVIHPNIENYTKLDYMSNATYMCYLNQSAATINSPCIYNKYSANVLKYIYPPIVGVPDAFSYVENLGGPEQYLSIINTLSGLFPTGINSDNYKQQQQNEVSQGISTNYEQAGTASAGTNQNNVVLPSSYINSKLSGYVVVPYKITTQLKQTWTETAQVPLSPIGLACPPFGTIAAALIGGEGGKVSVGSGGGVEGNIEKTQYKYAVQTLPEKTAGLNATIEGGSTYLKYIPSGTNYVQNLSDAGTIMPPDLDYQIFTNRLFGEIYINQTVDSRTAGAANANSRTSLPIVVNYAHLFNYEIKNYQQISAFGVANAYNVSIAIPVSSQSNGGCDKLCLIQSNYFKINPLLQLKSTLNYSNNNITQFFQLFDVFKEAQHVGLLDLNMSGNRNIYGYNRLVFTYVDRFNNTIYMPLDVDFANTTVITLNSNVLINPSNENETKITLSGTATYDTPSGPHPLPAGSDIYLYWNYNINYYNSISAPNGDNPLEYYTYAIRCALAPASTNCELANPLSSITQKQPIGGQEANQVVYSTDSGGAAGALTGGFTTSCSPPPKSLLQPIVYNCNIFGNYGLSAVRASPSNPSVYQYCSPYFTNGTGLFTSQLGLIAILKTDSSGSFSDTLYACGVGQNRIVAKYYGTPGPEPIIVNQTTLDKSGGNTEFASNIVKANTIISQEFNYSDAPAVEVSQFEIGSYGLSFGIISIVGLLVSIGVVSALLLREFAFGHKGKHASRKGGK